MNEQVYVNFQEYCTKCIRNQFTDYSYLLKRLLKEELIHRITDKIFLKWLIDNNMIDDFAQNLFFSNNQFKSFSNCYSNDRKTNFNKIFNL